jgi:hypothetical protein
MAETQERGLWRRPEEAGERHAGLKLGTTSNALERLDDTGTRAGVAALEVPRNMNNALAGLATPGVSP